MRNVFFLLMAMVLLGVGCSSANTNTTDAPPYPPPSFFTNFPEGDDVPDSPRLEDEMETPSSVTFPMADYKERLTYRRFGEYFSSRFSGYHTAEDVEYVEVKEEVPVVAIAGGIVEFVDFVSGYGGMIRIEHEIDGETISASYGHVDLASAGVSAGDKVEKGQFLANLGDDRSTETDGERKHLHFALWNGADDRINGYEASEAGLDRWINPANFFASKGMISDSLVRSYQGLDVPEAGDVFPLDFDVPAGWDVEYVPSIKSLNVYTVRGEGSARERSQLFIRYFDASQFLTLSTVTIHSTEDLKVGKGDYVARRYDIEKKPGVANFANQPSWRNERHVVTDFRRKDGLTRYFVVAANPDMDPEVYEDLLASMEIRQRKTPGTSVLGG